MGAVIVAVHDRELKSDEWWARSRPECPPDRDGVWWDENCFWCRQAYDAAIANGYGYRVVLYLDDGTELPIAKAPIRKWREMGLIDSEAQVPGTREQDQDE